MEGLTAVCGYNLLTTTVKKNVLFYHFKEKQGLLEILPDQIGKTI